MRPFWPVTEIAGPAGDFVALENLRRLLVVPVLHKPCLREPQPLRRPETSEKVGSPHFRDLSQLWPVTEIPDPAGSFAALEKTTQAGDCPNSSLVGFNGTVASATIRNKRKSRVVTLPSSIAIFASHGDTRSRWQFSSP